MNLKLFPKLQKEVIHFVLIRQRLGHTLPLHAPLSPSHKPWTLLHHAQVSTGL